MLTFMFWNVNRKPNEERIARLARRHDVDVLILAECDITPDTLLSKLNEDSEEYYYHPKFECPLIEVYARFPAEFTKFHREARRYSIRTLQPPNFAPILICMAHLPSKVYYDEIDSAAELAAMSTDIRNVENACGHARTIVMGDMNANPFEQGMSLCNGLHAVMARQVAEKGGRTVNEREYPFFYNPMWGHFGDGNNTPPGTYYQWRSTPHAYFWNMFDQMLIRPELLPYFEDSDLQIATTDGRESLLLESGIPNPAISDHLPIVFKLRLEEEIVQ